MSDVDPCERQAGSEKLSLIRVPEGIQPSGVRPVWRQVFDGRLRLGTTAEMSLGGGDDHDGRSVPWPDLPCVTQ